MSQQKFYTADEILAGAFPPEPAEEAYRRGYLDGFLAALDYVSEGKDIEWLYRFRNQVLNSWSATDTDHLIEPPQPATIWRLMKGLFNYEHFRPNPRRDKHHLPQERHGRQAV